MKCVLQTSRQLKRGLEVVALAEICCEGMRAVKEGVGAGGTG